LRALRDYTYALSPFYQQFHKGLYDAPLQDLPVLTKWIVMDHFDNLVTDRTLHPEEVRAFMANQRADKRFDATSGSSGHPGAFLANEAEWLTMRVSAFGAFEWAGIKIKLTHRVKIPTLASTTGFHMSDCLRHFFSRRNHNEKSQCPLLNSLIDSSRKTCKSRECVR